jgi:hypothetical protein
MVGMTEMSVRKDHQQLINTILAVSEDIRYAAVYLDGELASAVKDGLSGASSSESDKYEELIVNPVLLTLVKQRGDIDCGGARYILIRYGNFYQFVTPLRNGHLSVCLDPEADVMELIKLIQQKIEYIHL